MGATSHSSFYGAPLVTWDAAPAAAAYDVEWSRDRHRWRAAGHIRTPATSALLPVTGARGGIASAASTRRCPVTRK